MWPILWNMPWTFWAQFSNTNSMKKNKERKDSTVVTFKIDKKDLLEVKKGMSKQYHGNLSKFIRDCIMYSVRCER